MCWSGKGFTLFEVLLTLGIVAAIAAAIAGMLVASLATEEEGRVEATLGGEFSGGMSRLLSELRSAARLYLCGNDHIGFTQYAGPIVGTDSGVYLYDERKGGWQQINGSGTSVIPAGVSIRSLLTEETGSIFAGGSDGVVYKSTDCGTTWKGVGVGTGNIVAIDRAEDDTLYCLQQSPPAVYKSADDGATWTSTAPLPDPPANAYALICHRNNVIVGTQWNGCGNIYFSSDGGASWQVISAIYVPPGIWMYRRPVTITNRTSTNLTNYQVRIVVPYYEGKMRADFGDVRFKTGETPSSTDLPYWMEYYDSTQAIFWVKVPSLPANSTTTIWLFYGNPSATTLSDINATMEPTYQVYNNYPNQPPAPSTRLLTSGGRWVSLPFSFPFWRRFKNTTYVCYYGYLIFPPTDAVDDYTNSDPEFRQRCMIAGFWDYGYQIYSTDGTYYQSSSDNAVFEWRFGKRWWWWRWWWWWMHQKTRCQIFRNGDIVFYTVEVYPFNNRFTPHAIGVSLGNNRDYNILYPGFPPPQGRCWLFALRKWVNPEPSVSLGAETRLYDAARNVVSFDVSADGLNIYAGTAPDGWLFKSGDGKIWVRTNNTFVADTTSALAAEKKGRLCAGTAPDAIIYYSDDDGDSWVNLQQISGATTITAFCRRRDGTWFCVSDTGLLLRCSKPGDIFQTLSNVPSGNAYSLGLAFRRVLYRLQDADIERVSQGSLEVMARNIDSLNFTYYNESMEVITPTTQDERDKVAVVRVKYSLSRNGKRLERISSVLMRNLP